MDRQDLESTPSVMETIVSLDWMSPTAVEAKAWGIKNLKARVAFLPSKNQTWVIDDNSLVISTAIEEPSNPHDSEVTYQRYQLNQLRGGS